MTQDTQQTTEFTVPSTIEAIIHSELIFETNEPKIHRIEEIVRLGNGTQEEIDDLVAKLREEGASV